MRTHHHFILVALLSFPLLVIKTLLVMPRKFIRFFRFPPKLIAVFAFVVALQSSMVPSKADEIDQLITGALTGSVTGLPLPRFVSLKSRRTNMRVGPSFDHRVSWIYVKSGLPVEIVQEFEVWRRVRDMDGVEGWVHHAMVSSDRNAVVTPWAPGSFVELRKKPTDGAQPVARLQAGVHVDIGSCDNGWCSVLGRNFKGWMESGALWGVYPGEQVD